MSARVFIAYASQPTGVGDTICAAAKAATTAGRVFETWAAMDIPGRIIVDGILAKIEASEFVVADITRLNFNVTFEIAYAIGRQRRVIPIVHSALNPQLKEIAKLGLFDTIGYKSYSNAAELCGIFEKIASTEPLSFPATRIDATAPIFVLDTLYKTDASLRIIARIKKARLGYRSFDPAEQPRLSAVDAYRGVASSVATIVHLLSLEATDHELNNLRGAFLAGLSYGLSKETLIFQEAPEDVPLDYRDFVSTYKHPQDVDKQISDLVPRVTEVILSATAAAKPRGGLLAELDLGASAAENEIGHLANYYVPTDHYTQALSGNVRLAVGRKGSGKSALFFQVRDKVSSDREMVVLDLRPEGHQLKRFKEFVLQLVGESSQENLVAAFWEYVLLLELCHKILEKDRKVHIRDHTLYQPYLRLSDLYGDDALIGEGDFSERMQALVYRIVSDFGDRKDTSKELSAKQVVQLIYKHDIAKLRSELTNYLKVKKGAWILFDNIDKGWPTRGVEAADIVQLRGLLDATRTIERQFQREDIQFHSLVFLRNDVYELLVNETPDRGKETRVSLDWTDSDMLRELFRRRFLFSTNSPEAEFSTTWRQAFVSHIDGEDSSEYLIERSLMRPRNFINLINQCKSIAVNFRHQKIQVDDVRKALEVYSSDIGNELGLEIRDVFPSAEDLIYHFLGSRRLLTLEQIHKVFHATVVPEEQYSLLTEILLWFCFIGVVKEGQGEAEEVYAYSVFYDMKKLRRLAGDLKAPGTVFCINKAFWPFLEIQ